MEIPLLNDIVIIFGLSVAVLFICHRIRIPVIVGFLLTGTLAGPHGLGLIRAVHEVEILAEIGVVLLLFTIGIEFSLGNLMKIKKSVLIGGGLQVGLTILVVFVIAGYFDLSPGQSLFMGFLICLSSTAIALRLMQERAEVDSPHGKTSLAILIFQDIVVVPMILFTPILAGVKGDSDNALLILGAKGIAIILLVIISAKWIVPQVLYQITRTRSRELFLLSVVAICLAIAWLTAHAGLSLALGAFLAGLIISESPYSHQALGNILPFRDVFTSFFFVSIGMLLNIRFMYQELIPVLLIASGVLLLKMLFATLSSVLLGFSLRTSILVGFTLSQVGEFSFILSKKGVEHGLLTGDFYQMFLAFSILSMIATPFVIAIAPRIADLVSRMPLPHRLKNGSYPVAKQKIAEIKHHLIIIGFGITGRNVARAAKAANIPYVIIEMNPETVRRETEKGEPIYYGDATQDVVFHHANIKEAKIIVIAINDPTAMRRITEVARELNPKVHLLVRTRYFQEMKPLYELGANEVIPEEFETSVEIFIRVLMKYLIPKYDIEKLVAEVRADGYQMFRNISQSPVLCENLNFQIPDIEIIALRVKENAPLAGKTLAEMEMRKKYGVTLLAIRRDSEILSNPDGNVRIHENDIAILLGLPDKIASVIVLFRSDKIENLPLSH